jgi:inner membrane protein
VVGFAAGIAYGELLGHRGLTHSLLFAGVVGVAGALCAARLAASRGLAFLVLFLSTASHGVLDALTDGGLGVAFFSPVSNQRYFLPWSVIEVSPIGIRAFFSPWGAAVLASELRYVWAPLIALGLLGLAARRLARRP